MLAALLCNLPRPFIARIERQARREEAEKLEPILEKEIRRAEVVVKKAQLKARKTQDIELVNLADLNFTELRNAVEQAIRRTDVEFLHQTLKQLKRKRRRIMVLMFID